MARSLALDTSLFPQHRWNPIAERPRGSLVVHEIYRSIQGESTHAGLPCTFVRLTACHLRCRWCDTPHAFTEGTAMTPEAVLARVQSEPGRLVEITGGEPLLQDEVFPLMTSLADADIRGVDPRVHIIMDLKCPGSGEGAANLYENIELLKPTDEIKFVIADRADFEWACDRVRGGRLAERHAVLFSAVTGELEPRRLADWILESRLPVRLQLQLHKYIWDPSARGV
jgi:7-carboxy-7-deazaguanine synthase